MAKIFKFIFLSTILIGANVLFAQNKTVGYTTSWAGNENEIQFSTLTHLNYAFVFPNPDGTLGEVDDSEKLRRIVTKAHQNNVKVYISIAGGNLGSEHKEDALWVMLAENSKSRKTFVKEIMNFVSNYNLDGVDIYWTYPTTNQAGANFLSLMTDLNKSLASKSKELSTVVAPLGSMAEHFPTQVFAMVDHVNILTYESKDSASFTYDFALKSLNYWKNKGLTKEKAIVGIPFHTKYSWESYENIITNGGSPLDNYHRGEDYNGVNQVLAKAVMAKSLGGGVMVWEITHDTEDENSLLVTIKNAATGYQYHHIHTLENVKANPIIHKELLVENMQTVDSIIASNIKDAKVIKRD